MPTPLQRIPGSIQGRLLALVLTLVMGVWAATLLWSSLEAEHELDELLDGHLAQAAAVLVVQQAGDFDDDDEVAPEAPLLHRYAPRVAFQVLHEGRMTLRSDNAPAAPMRPADRDFRQGFETLTIDGAEWRVYAAYGGERDIQVYVGEAVASRHAILRGALRGLVVPMLIALPLLALAIWWAVRRGLAPLGALGRSLARREPQRLTPIPQDGLAAELRPMVASLNALFERIGSMVETERRFTADAAHELRTPIAAIRAQAQVALAASGDEQRRGALRHTLEGCDRATRLVEQLLTLSRLEGGEAPALALVDLRTVARRTVGDLAPTALAQGLQVEVELDDPAADGTPAAPADRPEDWSVRGNEALLQVLLRNLVDNALRYGGPGVRVQVRLSPARAASAGEGAARSGPLCTVEDSGPGLAEPDRQRLGERFFRVLGTPQPGSGLGWSIVRRIAAVHGAQIEVDRSAALGGLQVRVAFTPMR